MPSWWSHRPIDVRRKQQADEFSEFVDEQQNPPEPKPWDVPDTPAKGMPVGPDAARQFDQRANQQRQRWQSAMLAAIDQQAGAGPPPNGTPVASVETPEATPAPSGAPETPPEGPSPWAPWQNREPQPEQPRENLQADFYGPVQDSLWQRAVQAAAERQPGPAARAVMPGGTRADIDQAVEEANRWLGARPVDSQIGRSARAGLGQFTESMGGQVMPLLYETGQRMQRSGAESPFSAGGAVNLAVGGALRSVTQPERAKPIEAAGKQVYEQWTAKDKPPDEGLRSLLDPHYLETVGVETLAQSAPLMVLAALTALAAPKIVPAGLGAVGTAAAQAGVTVAGPRVLESLQNAGAVLQQAKAKGWDEDRAYEAARLAFLANLPLGALDMVQVIPFIGAARKPIQQAITKEIVRRFGPGVGLRLATVIGLGGSIAGNIVSEGGEEAIQEVEERVILGEPIEPTRVETAAGLGGLLGGAFGAAGAVTGRVQDRGLPQVAPGMTIEDVSLRRYPRPTGDAVLDRRLAVHNDAITDDAERLLDTIPAGQRMSKPGSSTAGVIEREGELWGLLERASRANMTGQPPVLRFEDVDRIKKELGVLRAWHMQEGRPRITYPEGRGLRGVTAEDVLEKRAERNWSRLMREEPEDVSGGQAEQERQLHAQIPNELLPKEEVRVRRPQGSLTTEEQARAAELRGRISALESGKRNKLGSWQSKQTIDEIDREQAPLRNELDALSYVTRPANLSDYIKAYRWTQKNLPSDAAISTRPLVEYIIARADREGVKLPGDITVEDVSEGQGAPRTYDAYLRDRATAGITAHERLLGGIRSKLRYEQPGTLDYDHDTRQVEFYQQGIEQYRSYLAGGPEPNRAYWASEYGNVKGALEEGVQVPDALLAKYPDAVKEVQSRAPTPELARKMPVEVQSQEAPVTDPLAEMAKAKYGIHDIVNRPTWVRATYAGGPAWSNGFILEVGEMPEDLASRKWEPNTSNPADANAIAPRDSSVVPAKAAGLYTTSGGHRVVVLVGPNGEYQAIDPAYYAYFAKRHPEARWEVNLIKGGPLRLVANGKLVGLVMPTVLAETEPAVARARQIAQTLPEPQLAASAPPPPVRRPRPVPVPPVEGANEFESLTYKPSDLYGSKQLYTGTADGETVWSNGHIIEFRDVPPKVEQMKGWTARYPNKDIAPFLNARKIEKPVSVTPVTVMPHKDGQTVVLTTGATGTPLERFRVLSAPYFAYFQKAYPGASYTADAKNPDRPVRVDAGGRTVGYILPIGQTNESATRIATLMDEQARGEEVPAVAPPAVTPATVVTPPMMPAAPEQPVNRLTANAADLAADYKARGMDRFKAWDQFIIDRTLRPDMDAKEFYRLFDSVSPDRLVARPKVQQSTAPAQPAREPDPESADYGRPVEVVSRYGTRTGKIERTLKNTEGQPVYEINYGPDKYGGMDVRRASTDETVRFLDEPSTVLPPAAPATEAATAAETGKQPWMMTRKAHGLAQNQPILKALRSRFRSGFDASIVVDRRQIQFTGVDAPHQLRVDRDGTLQYLSGKAWRQVPEDQVASLASTGRIYTKDLPPYVAHRKAVEQALAAGKPVPADVLADYPDLAEKAPQRQPEATPPSPPPAAAETPQPPPAIPSAGAPPEAAATTLPTTSEKPEPWSAIQTPLYHVTTNRADLLREGYREDRLQNAGAGANVGGYVWTTADPRSATELADTFRSLRTAWEQMGRPSTREFQDRLRYENPALHQRRQDFLVVGDPAQWTDVGIVPVVVNIPAGWVMPTGYSISRKIDPAMQRMRIAPDIETARAAEHEMVADEGPKLYVHADIRDTYPNVGIQGSVAIPIGYFDRGGTSTAPGHAYFVSGGTVPRVSEPAPEAAAPAAPTEAPATAGEAVATPADAYALESRWPARAPWRRVLARPHGETGPFDPATREMRYKTQAEAEAAATSAKRTNAGEYRVVPLPPLLTEAEAPAEVPPTEPATTAPAILLPADKRFRSNAARAREDTLRRWLEDYERDGQTARVEAVQSELDRRAGVAAAEKPEEGAPPVAAEPAAGVPTDTADTQAAATPPAKVVASVEVVQGEGSAPRTRRFFGRDWLIQFKGGESPRKGAGGMSFGGGGIALDKATDALGAILRDAYVAGDEIVLVTDGGRKRVKLRPEGNRFIDDEGLPWGLASPAFDNTGKEGFEIIPRKPTPAASATLPVSPATPPTPAEVVAEVEEKPEEARGDSENRNAFIEQVVRLHDGATASEILFRAFETDPTIHITVQDLADLVAAGRLTQRGTGPGATFSLPAPSTTTVPPVAADQALMLVEPPQAGAQPGETGGTPPPPAQNIAAVPPSAQPGQSDLDTLLRGLGAQDVQIGPAFKARLASLWHGFLTEFESRQHPVGRFERVAERVLKQKLNPLERISTYTALMPGASRAAQQQLTDELRPILLRVGKDLPYFEAMLVKYDQVDKAAATGNDPKRNWSWGTKPERLQATLDDMKARIGTERFTTLESAAGDYWAYMHRLLAMKRDSGLLSHDDYNFLTDRFPHYSPIRILAYLDDVNRGVYGAKRVSVSQNGIRHLTDEGTTKALLHPLEAAIDLTYQTHSLTAKNNAARAAAWIADRAPDLRAIIREVPDTYKVKANEMMLSAFDKGERRRFVIPKELGEAIESRDNEFVGFWLAASRLLSEPLRMGATGLNVLFLPANMVGDLLTYMVREPTATPKRYAKAAIGVFTNDQLTRAMMRSSAGMAGFYGTSAKEHAADLQRPNWYTVNSKSDIARIGKDFLTLRWVSTIGSKIEMVPRRATYAGRLEVGESPVEAAVAARRVTMDFARGGRATMMLNRFVPFSNVAFQAPFQVIRSMAGEQGSSLGAALKVAGLIIIPAILAELWNAADSDREKDYENVPEYIKNRSIPVMLPWSGEQKDRLGNRVPAYFEIRTREFSPFVMLTREAIKKWRGENGQSWDTLVKGMAQSWSPVQGEGGAEMASAVTPPLLTSIFEIATNRDFYRDQPIVPEERRHLPATEQFRPWTSETAKAMALVIGVPPAQVEHFITANFAGLGRQALWSGDVAISGAKKLTRMSQVPVPQKGEKVFAWWVPKKGDPEMRSAADARNLATQAERGEGALYLVTGRDEKQAKDRVYAKQYLSAVGAPKPVSQTPLVGPLIGTIYREQGGGRTEALAQARDKAMGTGTTEATRRVWALVSPRLDELRAEQSQIDAAPISGSEWRKQYHDLAIRRRGIIEGAAATIPAAAVMGERARRYDEIPILAKSIPDAKDRTDLLVNAYMAIEPVTGDTGLPDMERFFSEREAFLGAMAPEDRQAVETSLRKNATPKQQEYYRVQKVMGEYMALPRWAGVDAARSKELADAQKALQSITAQLPAGLKDKQLRGLAELQRTKGPEIANLAYEAVKRPINPERKAFWQAHPELNKFYSDIPWGDLLEGSAP